MNNSLTASTLRLLQLCSVNLPTGAYAFSQGLETATEEGWLKDMDGTQEWLEVQMRYGLGHTDLPILLRMINALNDSDGAKVDYWNKVALALRETKELRLNDCATGLALMRVLDSLNQGAIGMPLKIEGDISFVTAFALAAYRWHIDLDAACLGYAWSWLENQVAAATKLVPLGQTQSQQLLEQLQPNLLSVIESAKQCDDDEIGSNLPVLAIASCWHEHQYSRLFRS